MEHSKFLGKVIGIYLIIVCIAMFINMPAFIDRVNSLINNTALMFVVGFITLILGLLMVVSHNIWQLNWRVVITIISWLVLLKSISIIFYPQFIDQLSLSFVQNINVAYIGAAIDLILGLLLCYFGFKRSA